MTIRQTAKEPFISGKDQVAMDRRKPMSIPELVEEMVKVAERMEKKL